jgi:hypothetical protein
LVGAGGFVDMVLENLAEIDVEKLQTLAAKNYFRGGVEIIQTVRDVAASRPIQI